jgi:hypothetical protein
MAKLSALPEEAIINGFKGSVDFYVCRTIPCARAWPRARTVPFTPQEKANWPIFAIATRIWPLLDSETRESLERMTPAASLSARDLATKLYLNGTTIITNVEDNAFSRSW